MSFGLNGEVVQALRPEIYNAPLTSLTGSDVTSNQFNGRTRVIRIYSTEDIFFQLGDSAVATTADSMPIPGGLVEFIRVQPEEYMAVKALTTSGTVYYTEMS